MAINYPETEAFAYSFERGELNIAGRIFTAISNVDADQPTTSNVVKGTRPYPIAQTEGTMELGTFTISFSDQAERQALLQHLGNYWREKKFNFTWTRKAKGRDPIVEKYFGCRILAEPTKDQAGGEALGGDVTGNFMFCEKDGLVAHSGLPQTE
jgi:hypothetical protein